MRLEQKEWRGRFRLRNEIGSPVVLPWQWDSSRSPVLQRLEGIYTQAIDAADKVVNTKSQMEEANARFKRYGPDGLREKLGEFVTSEVAPTMKEAAGAVAKIKADLMARKDALKPFKSTDPKDAAAAVRRAEIRSFIRSLPTEKKVSLLLGPNSNSEYVEAVLEGQPLESDITPALHQQIFGAAMQSQYGPELEEIGHLEDAIKVAERALDAVRNDVRANTGADPLAE